MTDPGDPTIDVGEIVHLTIERPDPGSGDMIETTFAVPYTRHMRVLEALDYIVDELGETLAYQWFCGVKKCGMCAMTIDGTPALACWEPMLRERRVAPLAGLPVVRDLVVDRAPYDAAVDRLGLRLERTDDYAGFPEALLPDHMQDAVTLASCIECLICTAGCAARPNADANADTGYAGPAVAVQLAQFVHDPRDQADRAQQARDIGIEHACSDCGCTQLCPMGIDIHNLAVKPLKDLAG